MALKLYNLKIKLSMFSQNFYVILSFDIHYDL